MDPLQFLTTATVTIVAGKGGVGKTTVTAVLARAVIRTGLRVLVVELDGKPTLGRLLPGVEVLQLSATAALAEYLDTHGFSRVAKRLARTGVIDVVAAAAPLAELPLSSRKGEGVVLLVEDEAPVRAFASRALRLRGYSVLEADSAEAALAMLADPTLLVDIFVTDVIMPGKDGPTWVREALADRPDTKVVFVSGYAEDAFAEQQAMIPNSVFLPKPFSLTDLTTTVQRQLH